MKVIFDKVSVECELLEEGVSPSGSTYLVFKDPGGVDMAHFLRDPNAPPRPGTILQVLYRDGTLMVGELWTYVRGKFAFRAWPEKTGSSGTCTSPNAQSPESREKMN